MALGIIATIEAQADQVEFVGQTLQEVVPPSRRDDGCEHYTLTRDRENERVFVMVEQWRDRAALEAHLATEHYRQMAATLENRIAQMSVREYDILT
ncbi:quinol monooxygenase YgiN [Kushneria sinocarnis]|uniref:Quinol monooxygenase YgiN n=1 Tax=Kushneria sinocarnis TaxID=595502 RepID=A0A420X085_9GAMM|nr:putative quinol monooxygenase [Kushneria sinocarnis]RKR06927.1 quinol monooxygenase YgiN [Kushneria sinocarnis]